MNVELRHECEIAASDTIVWDVLADIESYARWNPFIRGLTGPLQVGARLEVTIAPPGGHAMTFRPRVLELTPRRELRWLGHLGLPGLFDGEHRFVLEPLAQDRVRFVQEERFSGLLVRPLRRTLIRTEQGFALMNAALTAEAERRAAAADPAATVRLPGRTG